VVVDVQCESPRAEKEYCEESLKRLASKSAPLLTKGEEWVEAGSTTDCSHC